MRRPTRSSAVWRDETILSGFASAHALHRDARAPVNLTRIAGLERHLHRRPGERPPRVARGARGGARTQPRRTDGMTSTATGRIERRPGNRGDRPPTCGPPTLTYALPGIRPNGLIHPAGGPRGSRSSRAQPIVVCSRSVREAGACAAAAPQRWCCCPGPRTPRRLLPRWNQENPSQRTRPQPGCDAARRMVDHGYAPGVLHEVTVAVTRDAKRAATGSVPRGGRRPASSSRVARSLERCRPSTRPPAGRSRCRSTRPLPTWGSRIEHRRAPSRR